jgi:hypothetical protein
MSGILVSLLLYTSNNVSLRAEEECFPWGPKLERREWISDWVVGERVSFEFAFEYFATQERILEKLFYAHGYKGGSGKW